MSMSTHVVGIKPPDEDWKKHKAVWDACTKAGVDIPDATLDFFDGEAPDNAGVIVEFDRPGMTTFVSEWSDDSASGFEVDIEKLPKGIKVLRFYNSW